MLWIANQQDSSTASRAMYPYSSNEKYYSDLINSYAWDTAIIFIQKYSEDTDYANQDGTSINSNLAKAGENADKRCNIQDLAGNACEWTTETSVPAESYSYTYRGSHYGTNYLKTKDRAVLPPLEENGVVSFRVILCVK